MVVFSIAQFFYSLKAYISILYNFYAIFALGVVLISAGMNINIGTDNSCFIGIHTAVVLFRTGIFETNIEFNKRMIL